MEASTLSRSTAAVRRPRRSLRFTRDDELVRLVRAGDEAAFEAIFDRHHRGILSFCRHMLGSREEAEDAVQHTFANAYRDLVGSDKPIQLKAWLYTIARNRSLSLLRVRREQVALDDAEPATEGLTAELQQRQDLRDMLADLHRLPEDQRAALVLSELGALSHEEIGVTLGVRKDKVKALVFQARESLASSRQARDADCQEIQEQIAVLRGGALRRTPLRRHIEICPACAAFKAEVQRQRTAMAALLPVVPSAALKDGVLAVIFGAGGIGGGGALVGGGSAGGGLLAAAGIKGLAAKVATIAVVAGGATGGGLMAVDEMSSAPADGPAEAFAGTPDEGGSVKLVESMRERARRAAVKRERDRAAASTAPAPDKADRPAKRSSGGTTTADARRDRDRGADRRQRPAAGDEPQTPTFVPAATGGEPPAGAPQPPPQPIPTASAPVHPQRVDDDEDDDNERGRGKRRRRGHDKTKGRNRLELPNRKSAPAAKAAPPASADDDSDSDSDVDGIDRHNRAKGRGHVEHEGEGNGHTKAPPSPGKPDDDDKKDDTERLITVIAPPDPITVRAEG